MNFRVYLAEKTPWLVILEIGNYLLWRHEYKYRHDYEYRHGPLAKSTLYRTRKRTEMTEHRDLTNGIMFQRHSDRRQRGGVGDAE